MDGWVTALPESDQGDGDAVPWGDEPMGEGARSGSPELPVGTVTFLLTDIAGSTRLWEDAPDPMAAATARHYELIDEVVRRCNGVRPVEQGEGDSTVSAFSRASDAVLAALDIQRAMRNEPWPDGAPISVRIGVHTGEAQLRDEGNYFGAAISRTARLRSTGHGGQILLSQATADLLAERLPNGATLRDLGTHTLRDLARPERIFQLDHPDLHGDFPPLISLDALPNNLPVQLTSFIGREREMAEVRTILETTRLLTLTGAGGCGKTRLALQIAAEMLDGFPEGVWLIDLAAVADPDLVAKAVAEALLIREAPNQPMIERLRSLLRDRKLLLVLDNCEHVITASASLAEALLMNCPGVSILATSREALGVNGESSWRVPSLSLPPERAQASIHLLSQCESIRLFVERAVRARPNFVLTEENAAAVSAICEQLDGIPLAIELAAARTRLLAPQQIAEALGDRFHLLTGGARSALARQRTLEASVKWSHDLLSEDEKVLFRRLAVFTGGFTLDSAEQVCSGDGIDQVHVLDLLSSLVDKSLVQVEEEGAAARYRLLETIRHYARENLFAAGEIATMRNRHLDFYVALAERAEPELETAGVVIWARKLEAELDNIRLAVEWSLSSGQADQALRLVGALPNFWAIEGLLNEAQGLYEAALALDGGTPAARLKACLGATYMSPSSANSRVIQAGEEALALAQQLDDKRGIARALGALVSVTPTSVEKQRLYEEAVAAADTAHDGWVAAQVRAAMGAFYNLYGRLDDAKRIAEEAVVIARRHNNYSNTIAAHYVLGMSAVLSGEIEKAQAVAEEGFNLLPELDERWSRHLSKIVEAVVALYRGDYATSRDIGSDVLNLSRRVGNDYLEGITLHALGWLEFASGHPDEAETLLRQAIGKGLGASIDVRATAWLIGTALDRGELRAAQELAESAEAIARDSGQRLVLGKAFWIDGQIARSIGDLDRAEDRTHEALSLAAASSDRPGVADALEQLAGLACSRESWSEAARLFGAGQSLRTAMGYARFPRLQPQHEADVAATRAALDEEVFEGTFGEGATLSMDEAISYATRARGERRRPSAGWASLTPTELDVVRFVAEGLTNPQIGEKMFISRGTVKVHLSHIFAKLGVTTRAELASEATRRRTDA
jgi:predicted ATPase/class 3 adenylate cyclase/DNA-binding CsgD family transcriptional regulator